MATNDLHTRVRKAVMRLHLYYPFWSSLLFQMPIEEATDPRIKTAATDGVKIWYNPQFISPLTDDQLQGLLAHEVGHPALGHLWRRGRREPQKANRAMDYVLNQILVDDGLKLPDGGLLDAQYKGKSFEAVYELLEDDDSGNGGQGQQRWDEHDLWDEGQGPGEGDQEGEGGPDGPQIKGSLQDTWMQRITQAAQIAKMEGKMGAGLSKVIEEILNPTLDWRDVLAEHLSTSTGQFNWIPPDRRFAHSGLYLPGRYSRNKLNGVVAWGDTSGSMGPEEMGRMHNEIMGMMANFSKARGTFALCDAMIHHWGDINEIPPTYEWKGGGGTDFRPIFDRVAQEGMPVKVMIGFTDGYGSYPENPPPYPMIWVIDGDFNPPFGLVLRYRRD
jgi:predicted metal-dependent peptidase